MRTHPCRHIILFHTLGTLYLLSMAGVDNSATGRKTARMVLAGTHVDDPRSTKKPYRMFASTSGGWHHGGGHGRFPSPTCARGQPLSPRRTWFTRAPILKAEGEKGPRM